MFAFQASQGSYKMGRPPLARAVAQLVFPFSAHLVTPQGLAGLQDGLPAFTLQTEPLASLQISIGPGAANSPRYVFASSEGYEAAITASNLTLSINESYRSRDAFQSTLESILTVMGQVGKIAEYERLGVRYINASPATVEQFLEWFRPEFTGWAGGKLVSPDTLRTWVLVTNLNQMSSDTVVNGATIRYGYLPNGVGQELTGSQATAEPSFIADIDMASFQRSPFDVQSIGALYRKINHEIAAFLRSSLTERGVEYFKLEPLEERG